MGYKMKGFSGFRDSPVKNKQLEKVVKESQSPVKCWKGYKRVAGTKEFSKGSCEKI